MSMKSGKLMLTSHVLIVAGLPTFGLPFFYAGFWALRYWIEGRGYGGMNFVTMRTMEMGVYSFAPGVAITLLGTVLRVIADYLVRMEVLHQSREMTAHSKTN